jgi:hypothetical protein
MGTRKCRCPFKLRGYFLASKEWKLTVVNDTHNHEFDRELDAHLVVGRLKSEEMKVVAELTRYRLGILCQHWRREIRLIRRIRNNCTMSVIN